MLHGTKGVKHLQCIMFKQMAHVRRSHTYISQPVMFVNEPAEAEL